MEYWGDEKYDQSGIGKTTTHDEMIGVRGVEDLSENASGQNRCVYSSVFNVTLLRKITNERTSYSSATASASNISTASIRQMVVKCSR
jgi:hypothetical protein